MRSVHEICWLALFGSTILSGCAGDPTTTTEPLGTSQDALSSCVNLTATADATLSYSDMRHDFGSKKVLLVGDKDESLVSFNLGQVPKAATIDSATFKLFVSNADSNKPINIHRATASWSESTVTFASFAQHFDSQIIGSITVNHDDVQRSADVTALTKDWIAGVQPNYGVLLETSARDDSTFVSREGGSIEQKPTLRVCYTTTSDHCTPNPCQNGATCENNAGGFTCHCTAGYTGTKCETPIGSCTGKPAGTPCSDGNACNGLEVCNATGTCVAGAPPAIDDGNPCTTDACNPATGVTHAPASAGVSCSDGNACNGAEACDGAGACRAGTPVVCGALDDCHQAGACDPSSGVCSNPAKADGASCDDHSACTQGDRCQGGACQAGLPVLVDDGNPCTIDACDPAAGITHAPVSAGVSCSDGNACNGSEACDGTGTCRSGTPVACSALDDCHQAGTCDPSSGVCSNPAKADGASCDDHSACTQGDRCQAGVCQAGLPVLVDDGNPCTADSCDPISGIAHLPVAAGVACSDGNACTTNDKCQAGTCVSGPIVAIDDGDPCTIDACTPTGGVTHTPDTSTACADSTTDPPILFASDFVPPSGPPNAAAGPVAIFDVNGVLPSNPSAQTSTRELGGELEGDLGGVTLQPSGALAGTAVLRLTLAPSSPAASAASVLLWTWNQSTNKWWLQSIGRVIGGSAFFPIRHFSEQRMTFVPYALPGTEPTRTVLPADYGGVIPPQFDYPQAYPYWDKGRLPASVAYDGTASQRFFKQSQGDNPADFTDPFPAGAGSNDGTVMVDDRAGIVRSTIGTVDIATACGAGLNPREGSARVSAGGQSVTWVASDQMTTRLCHLDLANHATSSCALPDNALVLTSTPGGAISADGSSLVFETNYALASDDQNGLADVYIAKLTGDSSCPTELVGRDSTGASFVQGTRLSGATRALSAHARFVAFTVFTVFDDTDVPQVYVRDRASSTSRFVGMLQQGRGMWSLSDSGRLLAYRPPFAGMTDEGRLPDFVTQDEARLLNVVDDTSAPIWRHFLEEHTTSPDDCSPLQVFYQNPLDSIHRFCTARRGPEDLSLSGDGHTVVFVASDSDYFYNLPRVMDFLEEQIYFSQRVSAPGLAPNVQFPVGIAELAPFDLVVGKVAHADAKVLAVGGPDGDYYEFPLAYDASGTARVSFPHGVAGGLYSTSILVVADGDLVVTEWRPAGAFLVTAKMPSTQIGAGPWEYLETPLQLADLRIEESGNRVELRRLSEVDPFTILPLPQQPSAAVTIPRLPEGSYEANVFVRVLGKDRLRGTVPFDVHLAFEDIGPGSSPSLSQDSNLVAFCRSTKVVVYDRTTRSEVVFDRPCDAVRFANDESTLVVARKNTIAILDRLTGAPTFESEAPLDAGVDVAQSASLSNRPISDDGGRVTYSYTVERFGTTTVQFSVVVDVSSGAQWTLLSVRSGLSGDGRWLVFQSPPQELVGGANGSDFKNEAIYRIDAGALLRDCPGHSPENTPPSCVLFTAVDLPDRSDGFDRHSSFHLADVGPNGEFLFFDEAGQGTNVWRLWAPATPLRKFVELESILGSYLEGLSVPGTLANTTTWLYSAQFATPSLQFFQAPGSTGQPLVEVPDAAVTEGLQKPFRGIAVARGERLLAFVSNYASNRLLGLGQAPVPLTSASLASSGHVLLVRAHPN